MKTKKCKVCNEEKLVSEFYKNGNSRRSTCITCELYLLKIDRLNRGTVKDKHNSYRNEEERIITFQFMQTLGWSFNTEKGIWYKNEFGKDKDGVWHYRKMKKTLINIIT